MPTETIKCPACGEEVSSDMENCPSCGAPTGVLFENDISGAPIDNSAAIDAMLRSASQFMKESESLGLDEMDIFNEESEDGEEDEEKEEAEEETVFKKVVLHELPPELSEEQKDGIQSGGIINLSASDSGGAAERKPVQVPDRAPAPPKAGGTLPDDLPDFSSASAPVSDGFVDLTQRETARQAEQAPTPTAAPSAAPDPAPDAENEPKGAKKSKKEKPPKKSAKKEKNSEPTLFEVDENGNPVKDKPKKEKRVKEKKPKSEKSGKQKGKSSPAAIALAAVIALAIGLCGGYFGKMFIFPELPVPECQEFAQRSVNAVVYNAIPEDMDIYIAEAYVNEGTYSTQCIFRAFTQNGDNIASRWFRVKLNRDKGSKPEIYLELSSEDYERLRNSENSEDRTRAAVLKSNQNELERCIKEAQSESGWSPANISLLNNTLHPYVEASETEATSKASADQPDEA
ncbi:MAG: zinc ribbon domain-containing protein [Bacteroides sp.]|nr:zinc ribbon domain-containing protein [Bacteroides sp.]